jgi:hypothetical protein
MELGFKRLKSLGELDALRAADPALARTWLLAHLIAGFPPRDRATAPLGNRAAPRQLWRAWQSARRHLIAAILAVPKRALRRRISQ